MERHEDELRHWTSLLKQVDGRLAGPARTLIHLTAYFQENGREGDKPGERYRTLPTWISDRNIAGGQSLLVHAVCGSTLQRLSRNRRRFPWLADDELKKLDKAVEGLPGVFNAHAERLPTLDYLATLDDDIFGAMNPLTAAEVFWLFVKAGEAHAHGPVGFLCLFAMLWALLRQHDDASVCGAALEPFRATAYVTAKCLVPIHQLVRIMERRAEFYRQIARHYDDLAKHAKGRTAHDRWMYALGLDRLSRLLADLAELTVAPGAFQEAANTISDAANDLDQTKKLTDSWAKVSSVVRSLFGSLADENDKTLEQTGDVITLQKEVVELLSTTEGRQRLRKEWCHQLPDYGDQRKSPDASERAEAAIQYWDRHVNAARTAADICVKCLEFLNKAVEIARSAPSDAGSEPWCELAKTNDEIAQQLRTAVRDAVNWCQRVVRQEIAYASAENDTEFDPAELLSAIATAERWHPVSELEIEEAIRRSLEGARRDGSWATGQPIYLEKRVLGVWPSTSDIVLVLTTALSHRLHIEHADEKLAKFVEWLERTGTRFDTDLDGKAVKVSGWTTETRDPYRIDLWTTAVSLNALLEIRNLIEHRLWQMCERHFFVAKDLKGLDQIDPVDLGAKHEHRLHRRLTRMTQQTSGPNYKQAEYAFILHGPPGSSKTALAEALGSEMWRDKKERRFVRVTPADFTRRGEGGLDAEARFIFDLLSHIRGATIFFDEIDDLLRRREGEASFLKLVVPAMLNRLQDLRDAAPRQELCFLMATNFISNIEPALTRPGRIDSPVPVPYPDPWSRFNTLDRHLKDRSLDDLLKQHLVDETRTWPWSTLNKLCREVAQGAGTKVPAFVIQDLDKLILRFRREFESAEGHYIKRAPHEWQLSAPLVNEFVYVTFAYSPYVAECAARVDGLHKDIRELVRAAVEEEWKGQERNHK